MAKVLSRPELIQGSSRVAGRARCVPAVLCKPVSHLRKAARWPVRGRLHAVEPLTQPEGSPDDIPDNSAQSFGSFDNEQYEQYEPTAADIKAALLDSLYGTERGLSARSEVRAEINELISQLEAKNPTPNPTEALDKLDGEWRLVYTSNSELIAVMALGKLPMVSVGDLTQKLNVASMTVENKVSLTLPLSKTSFSTTASFEVRSPKRLQLKLEQGRLATPQLLSEDMELPSSLSLMGQSLDLTQLKQALSPVSEQVKGLFGQLNSIMSQTPQLSIPLQSESAQTWQLNTYADEDTRITRGDGGSVFIYTRVPQGW